MIATIIRAETLDRERQMTPDEVRALVTGGADFSFIDVRVPDERTSALAEGSESLDYDASDKYMSLPKDRQLVFVCANGDRSLDVASYFMGHGFTDVYSVRGGLEAWHGA